MKPFEMLVLIKPGLGDEGLAGCRGRLEGWLAEGGGKVEDIVDVGELPLAYEIRKSGRAHFLLFWFESPSELPETLARRIRIDEDIIRHLLVERHPAATKTVKTAGEERERSDGKRG